MAVVSYKCPNCGGPLTFDADKQKFDCDYCYSEFTEQELIEKYKEETQDRVNSGIEQNRKGYAEITLKDKEIIKELLK